MRQPEKSFSDEKSLLEKFLPWGIISAAFLASLAAFSKKQRLAIMERDGHKCNYPLPHQCGGKLCVHQIIPPRYGEVVGVDPDFPENALTICKNIQAGEGGIYPDLAAATQTYSTDRSSFTKAIKIRAKKLTQRKIYWDDSHDREMTVTAVRNTQKARAEGWAFPEKKSRKIAK